VGESIWVDDAGMIRILKQLVPDRPTPELVFPYDKARAAWNKLIPVEPRPDWFFAEVTVIGQFETIASQGEPSGFGHGGKWRGLEHVPLGLSEHAPPERRARSLYASLQCLVTHTFAAFTC
jgi:hypothetical protein